MTDKNELDSVDIQVEFDIEFMQNLKLKNVHNFGHNSKSNRINET